MTGQTHLLAVERGMQRAFSLMSLVFAGTVVATMLPHTDTYSPNVVVTDWVFAAFLLVLTVRAWTVRLNRVDGAVGAGIAVLGELAYLAPAADVAPPAVRANIAVVAAILVAGFHRGRSRVALLGLITAVFLVVNVSIDGVVDGLQDLWPYLAPTAAAFYLAPVLRSAGSFADQARERLHEAGVRAAEATARRAAHRQFQRVLHDDIASALRVAATESADPARVRAEAASAIEHAEAVPGPPPGEPAAELWPAITAAADRAGVRVLHGRSDRVVAPADVVAAVRDATAELLRNVLRHAGTDEAMIDLRADGGGFVLRVTDSGAGFRPTRVRPGAVGLRDSVVRRVREVGGTVAIDSEPERGTSVEVAWRPSRSEQSPGEWETRRMRGLRAAVVDIRVPLYAVVVPYLAATAIPAVRNIGVSPAMPWLAGWFVLVAFATVALVERARRPVGPPCARGGSRWPGCSPCRRCSWASWRPAASSSRTPPTRCRRCWRGRSGW